MTTLVAVKSEIVNGVDRDGGGGYSATDGTPGQIISYPTNPSQPAQSEIYQCQDPALAFINCDVQAWNGEYDSSITAVVIDDGLTRDQWKFLESSSLGIDIVAYVTTWTGSTNDLANPRVYTSPNQNFIPSSQSPQHGFGVTSLMSLVGGTNLKVIFVDVQTSSSSDTNGFKMNGYYKYSHYNVFDWIYANAETYNIDLVQMSLTFEYNPDLWAKADLLTNKGIFMVTSAGNVNAQYNGGNSYPAFTKQWVTVGSVSHENRGKYVTTYVCEWIWYPYIQDCYYQTVWDDDYYSDKYQRTGVEVSPGGETGASWGSAWGTTSYSDYLTNGNGVDFVMPGNGVPKLYTWLQYTDGTTHPNGIWQYGIGTSYSAPLLSGAALAVIDGYLDGSATTPSGKLNPSKSTILSILKTSSSRSTWNTYLGWGYINIDNAYQLAYNQGVADGQVCYGQGCIG